MFYLDELRALEKEWPRFHFVPALSEPKPEENWTGETGLITDVLDRYHQGTRGQGPSARKATSAAAPA